jgi:PiT family inorganic phosphate transporter
MDGLFLLVVVIIFVALAFDYINGFHDAANSVATIVATRVLSPGQAVAWAAFWNFAAAFGFGTHVAQTVIKGVNMDVVTPYVILAGLIGAIAWDLITWYFGLPTSSSHALLGGYAGAGMAKVAMTRGFVNSFDALNPEAWYPTLAFIVIAPFLGMLLAYAIMIGIYWLFRNASPKRMDVYFRKLQLLSAAVFSFAHGTNDAQKTMGIIALALFTGTSSGAFNDLPTWASFLYTPEFTVARWVMITCALVMAAGTAAGGWRIIRTMGHKMVKLQPVHGFAAETTAAVVIQTASHWGIPLSTTHAISTSIMGVGAMKRFGAVKWGIVERIIWAWVLTLPVCGLIGFLTEMVCRHFGMK